LHKHKLSCTRQESFSLIADTVYT